MDIQFVNTRRKILNHVICSILVECGYDTCDKQALETLTEMLQSFIVEVGESARNYCELSGRTEPLIADVILGLINMGIKLENLENYGKRTNRTVLPPLQQQTQSKQLNILQAGVKQSHPSHIPSYLPAFPDPHAYIRTPTHKQPVTEYEAIREKAATQKRDIERALTRFIAKTGETHSLFLTDDNSMFPLISQHFYLKIKYLKQTKTFNLNQLLLKKKKNRKRKKQKKVLMYQMKIQNKQVKLLLSKMV
ncbi:transcription initiation factor TFIID subunit 8 isoform X2 [Vespa velutina]|uniref:transcription initiation factor TFIID subunit 8 isoform X2 n=1 Tax=Vespa velutina TaxID=202808 RepID=UPI001FB2DFA7|nr:transcription initiation factor TFIID subunit 8 isoform X2 [Vespa velutina]